MSLVAPPWATRQGHLAAKYHACGCWNCESRHYLDGDDGAVDCPMAVPVTVGGARRIYQHTEGTAHAEGVTGSDVQRGRKQYAQLMKADSGAFRARGPNILCDDSDGFVGYGNNHEAITTVLVSLRVAPTDAHNRLITPYRLVQDVRDAWDEASDEIPKTAGNGYLSYFWTIAGTDHWATPHIHWYGWFYDPDDTITRDQFAPMVRQFVDASAFAPLYPHFDDVTEAEEREQDMAAAVDIDDTATIEDGAVRIEHTPLLADPDRLQIRLADGFAGVERGRVAPRRVDEGHDVQSRGAIYVGTQLPKLALLGTENPAETEAAAFLDAVADGRHASHGGGFFYDLCDVADVFAEEEGHAPPAD